MIADYDLMTYNKALELLKNETLYSINIRDTALLYARYYNAYCYDKAQGASEEHLKIEKCALEIITERLVMAAMRDTGHFLMEDAKGVEYWTNS